MNVNRVLVTLFIIPFVISSCARSDRDRKTLHSYSPVEEVEDASVTDPEIVVEMGAPKGSILMEGRNNDKVVVKKTGVKFKNTQASFDDNSRLLKVTSNFEIKEKNIKSSFYIRGSINERGYANLFPSLEKDKDEKQTPVRGRATCIDISRKTKVATCHNIIIDIFLKSNGTYYTHQVQYRIKIKRKKNPTNQGTDTSENSNPSQDESPSSPTHQDPEKIETITSTSPEDIELEENEEEEEGDNSKVPSIIVSEAEKPPAVESETKENTQASDKEKDQPTPPAVIKSDNSHDPTEAAIENKKPENKESNPIEPEVKEKEPDSEEISKPGAYVAGTIINIDDIFEWNEDSNVDATPAIIKENESKRPVDQAYGYVNKCSRPSQRHCGRGGLDNSTNLVEHATHFMVLHQERKFSYATFDLMEVIDELAQHTKKLISGYRLQVSDCSKQYGGANGHKSHQNGLDADIAYIVKKPTTYKLNMVKNNSTLSSDFLVKENWEMIKSVLKNPITNVIFVGPVIKKKFCELARAEGSESMKLTKKMARLEEHDDHFHWRIKCTELNPRCKFEYVTNNTGCE